MFKIVAGIIVAAFLDDLIRWEAQKLLWRMEVNKPSPRPTPWKNQLVRMLAGERVKYGEQ